jgi:hypothetical protein
MCEDTNKMTQIEIGCEDVNRTSLGYGPVVGFCNNCSEPSNGINVSFLITWFIFFGSRENFHVITEMRKRALPNWSNNHVYAHALVWIQMVNVTKEHREEMSWSAFPHSGRWLQIVNIMKMLESKYDSLIPVQY